MKNATHTETIEPAAFETSYTREKRYASGDKGGAVSLVVSRADRGPEVIVRWNVNRGAGWRKGWKATKQSEAEALAFAAEKWPTLIKWLLETELAEDGGAVAAFSAQVASMWR